MERYFTVHYPRRLQELKETLTPLADIIARLSKEKPFTEESTTFKNWCNQFQKEINLFAENTKLHLTQCQANAGEKYLHMLMPKYLYEFFGGETTNVGIIFGVLYKTKM